MTSRERFQAVMNFQSFDRLPLFEWAVWWDKTIERWHKEGLPANTETIGTILQKAGYTTGAIGKRGLGGPDSTGEPNKQGFDHWCGYLCQRVAHDYYPTHL